MVLYIIIAVLLLLVMVAIHEFGHYIVGKLLGFKINEFAVGFGPKLLSKTRKNGEVISLRAIPLGGYCAFEGEDEVQADPAVKTKSFYSEKPYKRILVLLAGAIFNLVSAVFFSFIFILVVGFAQPMISQIEVDSQGVAYNDFVVGDVIIAVDDNEISIMDNFSSLVSDKSLGDVVSLTINRFGEIITLDAEVKQIGSDDDAYVGFGITTYSQYESVSVLYALKYSVPFAGKMAISVIDALGMVVSGSVGIDQMTGPVGTITLMAELGQMNWQNFLLLLPLLSANLGIFNLLPIPSLDGSKVIFTTIEWVRGKPINQKIENIIHLVGLALLFGFVIFLDIFAFI